MAYKIIEVLVDEKFIESIDKISKKNEIINTWKIVNQNNFTKYSMIVEEKNVEIVVDFISKALGFNKELEDTKEVSNTMVLSPIDGFLPKIKSIEDNAAKTKKKNLKAVDRISTEEMFDDILNASRFSQNFLLNVILASIVCSIGIIRKDTSIFIAASAIAPFLGSIMGYSFSLSIGDSDLMKNSAKTLLFGIVLSMLIGMSIGFLWNYLPGTYSIDLTQNLFQEMRINHYTFVLALASGASAALALTAGTPTIMASFMLSVSMLPNITIAGITLGNGFYKFFVSLILLLAINLICIIFASQLIFAFKKIKPKTKEAIENYKDNNIINIVYCIFVLVILIFLKILVRNA